MEFPSPSETFACGDIRALKELGADVSVYTLKPKHINHFKMLVQRKVSDIPVFNTGLLGSFLGIFYALIHPFLFLSLAVWIIKEDCKNSSHCLKMLLLIPSAFYILMSLEKTKPDVVHLFWGHYPSIVGYLVNRRLPKTKLTMFLGAYDLEMSLGVSLSLSKNVEIIFTHASCNLSTLKKMGFESDKIKVIYRGVDVAGLERKKILNYKCKTNLKMVTAGRLVPMKGFENVINIFSKCYLLNDSISLHIIGDGPDKSRLEKIVYEKGLSNSIEFTGFISQNELIEYMYNSSIFLFFSSKQGERLPNVVKEAMLTGCICIVSYTPGIDELITSEANGFIINDELDHDELAVKIISILSDNESSVSEYARDKIINNFDVKKCMSKYLKNWSRL